MRTICFIFKVLASTLVSRDIFIPARDIHCRLYLRRYFLTLCRAKFVVTFSILSLLLHLQEEKAVGYTQIHSIYPLNQGYS